MLLNAYYYRLRQAQADSFIIGQYVSTKLSVQECYVLHPDSYRECDTSSSHSTGLKKRRSYSTAWFKTHPNIISRKPNKLPTPPKRGEYYALKKVLWV